MSKQSAGGKARAAKMTPEQRSAACRAAAQKRWHSSEAPVPRKTPGAAFVYGLGPEGGPIKIGHGADVSARRQGSQIGNHLKLAVYFCVEVPAKHARIVEQKVHHRLREHRIRGEWFDVAPDIAKAAADAALAEVHDGDLGFVNSAGGTSLIYLAEPMLATMRAYASDRGLDLHAAILALVDLGLQRVTLPVAPPKPGTVKTIADKTFYMTPKGVLAEAERKAAHLAKPRPKSKWSLKGVHLGPVEAPPGSRLKGSTPRKSKA